ncbi:MAG: hypothetical protein IKE25_05740 [Clostridia bacterium]|nr:hypothetical protein [Clostridia bacterium]
MPDREKIIEGLEMSYKYSNVDEHNTLVSQQLVLDAIEALKEQEWHMLTEDDDGFIFGLPGDDGQYLMTDGKDIWIDDYIDGVDDGVWLDSGRDIREITAWMYMPELPKEDKDGE